MTAADHVAHAERFGPDGVLEAAACELSEGEYAELARRLATRCAAPACLRRFVPSRKDQVYCSAGCRQKAHRLRRGASSRFAVGRSKPF